MADRLADPELGVRNSVGFCPGPQQRVKQAIQAEG